MIFGYHSGSEPPIWCWVCLKITLMTRAPSCIWFSGHVHHCLWAKEYHEITMIEFLMIHHYPKKQTQIVTKMIKHVGSFGRDEPRQGAFIPSRGQSDFVCSICLNIHPPVWRSYVQFVHGCPARWSSEMSRVGHQVSTSLQLHYSGQYHTSTWIVPMYGRQRAYFCRVSYQPPLQCCRATGYAPCSSNSKTFCNLRSSLANAATAFETLAGSDWTPQ